MNRRTFLSSGAVASVTSAGLRPRYVRAAQLASQHGEIYKKLGVRPFINAAGTYTILTGSIMPEAARRAMEEASRSFVRLEDLQKAVGERIAKLLDAFQRLIHNGGSILIIEHNLDVVRSADWIIDLGPEGGDLGGRIIAQGTPEQIAECRTSYTGRYLKKELVASAG